MAAPSSARELWLQEGFVAVSFFFFFLPAFSAAAGTEEGGSTSEFDVRPGGVVHSFSRSLGDYSCTFTYAAQGGTNEKWQMSVGLSEDNSLFLCSVWRPQGKSYLFFTQFKAEVTGAKVQYGIAYSAAAAGGQSDVLLKEEEFYVTETAVSHREGKFRSELSKLVIVAQTAHSEL